MHKEILRLENLHPLAVQNNSIYLNLSVEEGESVCILTQDINFRLFMMQTLLGQNEAYSGRIRINGVVHDIHSVQDAHTCGIYHVDLNRLFPNLDIANNLFLTNLPSDNRGMLQDHVLYQKTRELLDDFGLDFLDPHMQVRKLEEFYKDIISFLRAVCYGARIILVDFTFSRDYSLEEIYLLTRIFRKIKEKDISLICFGGFLQPFFRYFDKLVTVQDSVVTRVCALDSGLPDAVLRPQKESDNFKTEEKSGKGLLECVNFPYLSRGREKMLSFELHEGEVLGLLDPYRELQRDASRNITKRLDYFQDFLRLNGKPFQKQKKQTSILAVVDFGFQNESIIPTMDLKDNLTLMAGAPLYDKLGFFHAGIRDFMARKILADIGREDIYHKYRGAKTIRAMAPEEQFIVAVCRQLYLKPKAFIFYNNEENYSMLSTTFIPQLYGKLKELHYPVILISGGVAELEKYCDRYISLEQMDD